MIGADRKHILEHTSGHLVDPKSSKVLSQKVLSKNFLPLQLSELNYIAYKKSYQRISYFKNLYYVYKTGSKSPIYQNGFNKPSDSITIFGDPTLLKKGHQSTMGVPFHVL